LPTHWLGRALGLLLSLDEPLPEMLGLVVELPVLPEVCAHEALARPSSAAATAALSVFTITMYAPLVER